MKLSTVVSVVVATLGLAAPIPVTQALEAAEKAAVCAGCHGASGRSAVPDNPILAGQHADYLGSALRGYIKGDRNHGIMKTMAGRLGEQNLDEIAQYYAAQSPYQSEFPASGDAERGKGKITVCVACHGETGRSASPIFPNLAGQHAVYLGKALRAYRSGARSSNLMLVSLTEKLSDADIDDIAAYYAAQSVPPSTAEDNQ